jgi:hypothetical protein
MMVMMMMMTATIIMMITCACSGHSRSNKAALSRGACHLIGDFYTFNCRLLHNAAFATTSAASHVIGLCAVAHADFLKPLIMVKRMTMVRRAARTGGP